MQPDPAIDWTPVAKTVPPARPGGLVPRPVLAQRISEVLERRLTLVVADAGFGKSTLLGSWWETTACAWYTLDPSDRDLRSLVRGLIASLRLRVQLRRPPVGDGHVQLDLPAVRGCGGVRGGPGNGRQGLSEARRPLTPEPKCLDRHMQI